MNIPNERYMSSQAWRRLRRTMTDSELADLARDLAAWVGLSAEQTKETEFALTSFPWEAKRQA